MKVTQEKLPASQIGLEIEVPAETSKQVYENIVQRLAKSVKLPGFRKGKVPRHILLQRLGPQRVKIEALEELIQESLDKAIKGEKIDAIGNYQLVSSIEELLEKYNPGEALTFSARVDVPAEVELGDYSSLKATAEKTEYDPQEVEDLIERQRESHAILVPVEGRAVQMGDVAIVDYSGRLADAEGDEAALEGVEAENFQMDIAEGKFISGLVEGVVGMNIGETKDIAVTFPEDYPKEDVAGENVIFAVTVKEIKEKELPELDDDFAEEVSEYETMAELLESLEKQYREKAERETQASVNEALIQELLKVAKIDPPATTVEREIDTMLTQTAMQMQQYGMDIGTLFNQETIPKIRQESRQEAVVNVQRSLALLEIAKRESLEATEEEIAAKSKELLEELDDRDVDTDRLHSFVKDDLSKEKVLVWLRERAEIEYVPKGSLEEEEEEGESEAVEVEVLPSSEEE